MISNVKVNGAGRHVPAGSMEAAQEREYVARLLAGYAGSIEHGIRSFAGGSDVERGYLLGKIKNLFDAVEHYL